ncbi:tripeptidyl-peptidase-like protein [Xylariales sp. AK1849]|nr:tripeptidyl-peptidase-like protein [Xylariales sp. AK1849]
MLLFFAASLIAVASAKILSIPADGHDLPAGWKHVGRAEVTETIDLSIELHQPGIQKLKTRLAATSDPNHAEYGHHLTKDEVDAYQTPDHDALRSVSSWLRDEGVMNARIEGASIKFRSSSEKVRSLLDADIGRYSFRRSPTYLRAPRYTIPDHLAGHIRFVHPLSHFAKPARTLPEELTRRDTSLRRGTARRDVVRRDTKYTPYKVVPRQNQVNESQPCPNGTVPECLQGMYKVPSPDEGCGKSGTSKARLGVAGFLDQYAHYDDIGSFLQKYAPGVAARGYNFTVELLANATNPQSPDNSAGPEASLDLEYAMALGYPTDITYYLMDGRGTMLDENGTAISGDDSSNEPFLEFLQYINSLTDDVIPHVLSISYGDDEESVPYEYATKVCDMFAQLAARGLTVFVGSGDGGASGTGLGDCYSNDGRRRKEFLPTFPASCPYVTSVGATTSTLPLEGSRVSGGGFSNYFPTPDWQQEDSAQYIKIMNGAHMGFYNATGRATPDISAIGEQYTVLSAGEESQVDGTSASTPVVAALVARVNQERLKQGKNSTGWLNPLLYSSKVRKAFVDVSAGSNTGCIYGKNDTEPGFAAYHGYDCVTGIGSIGTYEKLLEALG